MTTTSETTTATKKEDIMTRLKEHIAEEKDDAQTYYELAKEAKENGKSKLAFVLSGICNDEINHFDKITRCVMNAEMTNPITDEDKEEMDYLKYKLMKL